MISSLERSALIGSGVILLFRLIPLSILLNLLHSPTLFASSSSSSGNSANVNANSSSSASANPLVYTRLRHDRNYLQLYRAYQLEHLYEEKRVELQVNETLDGDSSKGKEARQVVYTYYENKEVDANSITKDDLILEALDRTYKTRLIPAYLYNYDDPDERRKASDQSLISESKCRRDLEYLSSKLLSTKSSDPINPELAAFFDSYASEESGLLFGNYHWIGNWRQCYKREVFDKTTNPSSVTHFKGRYCTASIRSKDWDSKIRTKTEQLLKAGNYFKYPEQQYDYARFFRIQVGICLPESCDSRTIETQRELIRQLTLHRLQEPLLKSYQLVDLFCLPDETSELRQLSTSALTLLFLATVWCFAIIVATCYDLRLKNSPISAPNQKAAAAARPKTSVDKLVSALSLLRNYHRLTETQSLVPPQPAAAAAAAAGVPKQHQQDTTKGAAVEAPKLVPNDLLFLNAIKVISMPCILFGHVGMLSIMLNRLPLYYDALEMDWLNHFNISSVFFVDWYFVVTGFLASYLSFVCKKIERNTLGQWLYSIFHRYWRLAPMYVLLFWFSKSLFKHTGNGPVWDYGTNNMTLRSVCQRESWLWPLALMSNFHPIHDECIMPSWYIANDMQFYIITPFILIGLAKRPILSWLATIGLISAGCLARMARYLTDPRAQPLELMRPRYDAYMRNNWDMHPTYIEPQYRIPSYLIGLLAGHYTYMVLSGQWRSPIYKCRQMRGDDKASTRGAPTKSSRADKIRSVLRAYVCLLGFQMLFTMMFASWVISDLFPRSLEPHVRYFTAMIYGTSHASTSLGLSFICVTLMFGQFGWLKRLLSLPIFTVISRVNYFVFLAQVELIYWLAQSSERMLDLTPRDAFKNWITLAAATYPLAVAATLWLELPLAHLEREFIGSLVAAHYAGKPKRPQAGASGKAPEACDGGTKLIAANDDHDYGSESSNNNKSTANRKRHNNNNNNKNSNDCELATRNTIKNAKSDDTLASSGTNRESPVEVRID